MASTGSRRLRLFQKERLLYHVDIQLKGGLTSSPALGVWCGYCTSVVTKKKILGEWMGVIWEHGARLLGHGAICFLGVYDAAMQNTSKDCLNTTRRPGAGSIMNLTG